MTKPAVKATKKGLSSTTSEFADYKTGEDVTCLSQGEMMLWYILRWDDDVDHIDTQVAMDNKRVDRIIAEMETSDVYTPDELDPDAREPLSTDVVAYLRNGQRYAFQVKADRSELDNINTVRRLYIEDLYWKTLNVPWKLVFKSEMNRVYVENIRAAVRYYDDSKVHDEVSRFQHLVAVKEVKIDMTVPIDWMNLSKEYWSEHHA